MKHITFYFDAISPYAYLAFEQFPKYLMGISHSVTYRPVLLGAVLQHFGQLGPAEIQPKRTWTYRHINWLAKSQGTLLQMPASHPFNSLSLLRLAVACGQGGACNRYAAENVFRHVWLGGQDAGDAHRLLALTEQLAPKRSPQDAAVKAELRFNTETAIARGIFGVPTFEVDGQQFWGLDALPMLRACLEGDDWFASAAWAEASDLPVGIVRKAS
jgi:2-hydroxychromene-2-carboxylate isomerase